MANTLKFKRGLVAGLPTAALGEPLFTTDTFDLYIGNGTGNTRFQKYIASGATTQILRGDGSLYTFPLAISSPSNGQVLKYNGTSWVNDSDSGITGSGTAGQVAYFTGASTQGGSNNLFWDNTNGRLGIGTNTPSYLLHAFINSNAQLYFQNVSQSNLFLSGTNATLLINNTGGSFPGVRLQHTGTSVGGMEANATSSIDFISLSSGIPILFRQVSNERARFFASTGNFGINTGTSDSGQRLQVNGTGYFSDKVGIGVGTPNEITLNIRKNITGATSAYGIYLGGDVQNDVTANLLNYYSRPNVASGTTLSNLYHYAIDQGTYTGTVTNQYGFWAGSSLTGATNNYGFYGNIASGTNRWNLYMNGTANNYINGSVGIGVTNPALKLDVVGAIGARGRNYVTSFDASTGDGIFMQAFAGYGELKMNNNGHYLSFVIGTTERMRLDASGNLGLGVTPSAWSVVRGLQVGVSASLGGYAATTEGMFLSSNSFYNGGAFVRQITGNATQYLQISGQHRWSTAASDTAGTSITFTQAMTLDASGNLGVGLTTHTSKFEVFKSANDTLSRANAAVGIGDFVYGAGLLMQQRVSAPYGFMVQATNSAVNTFYPLLLQPSGGNVVLGATSDSGERLQVTGTAKITGASVFGGSMTINNDLRLVTSSTGGITIEASSGAETPNLTFLSTTNRYNLDNSSGTLRFFREDTNGTNGAVRMSLTDSGLLLLGSSTSTGEQLQVTGTAKITANNVQLTLQTASATGYASTTYVTASRSFVTGVGGASAGVTETRDAYYIYDNTASAVRLSINSSGNVSIANNLAVDTNTLFVDATNNRVGIGTASPSAALHIVGTESRFGGVSSGFISLYNASNRSGYIQANNTVDLRIASDNDPMTFYIAGSERARFTTGGNLLINTTTDSGYKLRVNGTGYFDDNLRFPNLKGVVFVQTGGSLLGSISMDSSNQVTIDNNGFFGLSVGTNYNLLGGNTGIGTNTFGTSATRTFAMLNGTAPSTSPTDTFQMYSNDVTAGNAAPHFRTENGAVIKLYQETTSVGNSIISLGGGNAVLDDTTFDGYTLRQIVKALRNQGILA